jgi:hypothetical protein
MVLRKRHNWPFDLDAWPRLTVEVMRHGAWLYSQSLMRPAVIYSMNMYPTCDGAIPNLAHTVLILADANPKSRIAGGGF